MFDIPRLQGLPFRRDHIGLLYVNMAAMSYVESLGYTHEEFCRLLESLSSDRLCHLAHILHPIINKHLESEWLDRVARPAVDRVFANLAPLLRRQW